MNPRRFGAVTRVGTAVVGVIALAAVTLLASSAGRSWRFIYALRSHDSQLGQDAGGTWRDSVSELLLPLLDDHDTVYASGYTEAGFRNLAIGTTDAEVLTILGSPIATRRGFNGTTFEDDDHVLWDYSQHGTRSKSYFCRVLEFDANGRLIKKRAAFNLD